MSWHWFLLAMAGRVLKSTPSCWELCGLLWGLYHRAVPKLSFIWYLSLVAPWPRCLTGSLWLPLRSLILRSHSSHRFSLLRLHCPSGCPFFAKSIGNSWAHLVPQTHISDLYFIGVQWQSSIPCHNQVLISSLSQILDLQQQRAHNELLWFFLKLLLFGLRPGGCTSSVVSSTKTNFTKSFFQGIFWLLNTID